MSVESQFIYTFYFWFDLFSHVILSCYLSFGAGGGGRVEGLGEGGVLWKCSSSDNVNRFLFQKSNLPFVICRGRSYSTSPNLKWYQFSLT